MSRYGLSLLISFLCAGLILMSTLFHREVEENRRLTRQAVKDYAISRTLLPTITAYTLSSDECNTDLTTTATMQRPKLPRYTSPGQRKPTA